MKHILTLAVLAFSLNLNAQKLSIPNDTTVVTQHRTTINGSKIKYTAKTGTQPLWDKKGNPIATLYYTYYSKSGTSDYSNRPLLISFNKLIFQFSKYQYLMHHLM